MTDQNMPTTYETQTTSQPMSIGLHKEYLRTLPGILKMVEIVLSLITFICAVSGHWWYCWGCQGWVDFVALTAFFSTLIMFIFYLIGLYSRFPSFRVLILLSLGSFVSSCFDTWPLPIGQGFCIFSTSAGFLFTLAYFLLHVLSIFAQHPHHALPTVLSFVAFVCSASEYFRGQGYVEFVSLCSVFCVLILFILHLVNVINRLPGPWKMIEFVYYCVFTGLFVIASIVAAAQANKSSGAVGAATFFSFAATAVYAVDTFFQFRAWRSGQTDMGHNTTTTTTAPAPGYNPEAGKTTY